MDIGAVSDFIQHFGFAAAVAGFLLWRLEPKLASICVTLARNGEILRNLENKLLKPVDRIGKGS